MIKNKALKIITIVGTRPEIIRLSRVMARLDEYVNQIIVHTGQNYDYELNEVFFNDLNIRKPDYFLNVDTSSLGATAGDIIRKTEEVLKKENPDALLVLGDTNSSLSAYIARRMHITIFHMEAGNRCFDFNVPEEINRRIIDHISDYNLVYTEHARRHLIAEGLPQRRIYLTGSPLNEVLRFYEDKINNSTILDKLKLDRNRYFVVSTHREENVDNPENLAKILAALNLIASEYNYPVIVSTHPRTMKRLKENFNSDKLNSLINFLKPFGFFDYVALQKNAACVISDSGTISEESAMLSFPAISLRNSMERPEAQDAGTVILSGLDSDIILSSVETVIDEHSKGSYKEIPADYKIENTSWRVVKLILGNTRLSNKWDAIYKPLTL
ncbi:MAG: UDP-N-acetylglucosamine 2-epimerase (non-hydrolyzing) [Ignavibacteriaceae bacterium]|nr:UDP-N-acetylglucosamine 2-epimerase (non-hydrolyzing) [Ignavibacteriaceae bacterium]